MVLTEGGGGMLATQWGTCLCGWGALGCEHLPLMMAPWWGMTGGLGKGRWTTEKKFLYNSFQRFPLALTLTGLGRGLSESDTFCPFCSWIFLVCFFKSKFRQNPF